MFFRVTINYYWNRKPTRIDGRLIIWRYDIVYPQGRRVYVRHIQNPSQCYNTDFGARNFSHKARYLYNMLFIVYDLHRYSICRCVVWMVYLNQAWVTARFSLRKTWKLIFIKTYITHNNKLPISISLLVLFKRHYREVDRVVTKKCKIY